jgi:glutathione S-transferase
MGDTPLLYWWPGTCSRVTLVALEEIGEPFELHLVDKIAGDDRGTPYRTVNPKGKVPALRIDGRILTETSAIALFDHSSRMGSP